MARGLKLYDSRLAWALIAPTLLLLLLFLVLPIVVMTAYTFFTFVTAGVETAALTLANWQEFLFDTYYHGFLWKTVRVGVTTAMLCALVGYSPAYFIWSTTFRHKWLLLLLLIVPFWISFTIRTFSWIHILGEQGLINVVLLRSGVIGEPMPMLYTEGAVIMGLLHFLLPYMILNVYVSLEDRPHPDLGRPLAGLHQLAGFREVTLPLSLPAWRGPAALLRARRRKLCDAADARRQPRRAVRQLIYDTIMSQLNWPMAQPCRSCCSSCWAASPPPIPATWACRRS